jgi:hypothetical protein
LEDRQRPFEQPRLALEVEVKVRLIARDCHHDRVSHALFGRAGRENKQIVVVHTFTSSTRSSSSWATRHARESMTKGHYSDGQRVDLREGC